MAVKMRLQRHGSKKRPFYFIVVADGRSPRDGKFIQKLGYVQSFDGSCDYPGRPPKSIGTGCKKVLNPPTLYAASFLFKGVLYLKHLLRGVGLGLFDEAVAMEKFTKWSSEHDAHIAKRQGAHKKARMDKRNQPVVRKVAKHRQPQQKKPKQKNNYLCSVNSLSSVNC